MTSGWNHSSSRGSASVCKGANSTPVKEKIRWSHSSVSNRNIWCYLVCFISYLRDLQWIDSVISLYWSMLKTIFFYIIAPSFHRTMINEVILVHIFLPVSHHSSFPWIPHWSYSTPCKGHIFLKHGWFTSILVKDDQSQNITIDPLLAVNRWDMTDGTLGGGPGEDPELARGTTKRMMQFSVTN